MWNLSFIIEKSQIALAEQLFEDLSPFSFSQKFLNNKNKINSFDTNSDMGVKISAFYYDEEILIKDYLILKKNISSFREFKIHEIDNEKDWDLEWRRKWSPTMRPTGLCICPSWLDNPFNSKYEVKVNPGQAFGTGTHESTRLCLDYLAVKSLDRSSKIIDYGCGSGILSIAASEFGFTKITATDHDPEALNVMQENLILNSKKELISIISTSKASGYKFDIIIANILLQTLIELKDEFNSITTERASLILSGLTFDQIDALTNVFKASWDVRAIVVSSGWVLVTFLRRCK